MSKEIANQKVTIKKGPLIPINDEQLSKVYVTNNIIEVITVKKRTSSMPYKKITSDTLLNTETGELIQCQHRASRIENHKNLKHSFSTLRRLLNNNLTGSKSEKHIILTYANMVDYNTACLDFKNFWSRFLYKHPSCDYIRIIEPQQSGNWHIHVLVIDHTVKSLYIDYNELYKMWRLGIVHVNDLPFAENFGAYFIPRLINNDIYEDDDAVFEEGSLRAIVKGGRLRFYPPSFKLYTCSKGIKRPIPIDMPYAEVRQLVHNRSPSYSCTSHIINTDDNGMEYELNSITFEQYKIKN